MPDRPHKLSAPLARARQELLRTLATVEFLCRGTLLKRTKVCGKSSCRCAQDPSARHGPYYEWGRMEGGRLVHTVVSPQQAAELLRAIRAHRQVQRLLRKWERESAKAILMPTARNR